MPDEPWVLEPASKMRKAIARTMSLSARDIPQGTVELDVDVTETRAVIDRRREAGSATSLTDLIVAATARALLAEPALNASWADGEGIRRYRQVNIGLVYVKDDGLLIPVIHGAERLSVDELTVSRKRLETAVRGGVVSMRDLSDATFTISNLGPFGIPRFHALINPPQAGILAVGAAAMRPVVRQGEFAAAEMLTLAVTVDHRVVDGVHAARFLQELQRLLQRPADLVQPMECAS